MKNHLTLFLAVTVAALAISLVPLVHLGAQTEADGTDQMLPLAQTIAEQQKQIAENEIQIEKTVLSIQEELRQAKIYVSRSGKAPKK